MNSQVTNRNGALALRNPAQLDYVLLDASSSMSTRWLDSLTAIDGYAEGLKLGNINSHLKTVAFSSRGYKGLAFDTVCDGDVGSYSRLAGSDVPMEGGMTPLYDAINAMGRELQEINPQKCSILIVTDGNENESKTTHTQAKSILDWCRAKGWQVTFLGCDFDNSKQAKLLGADAKNSIGTSKTQLKNATKLLAAKRRDYSTYGTPMDYTKDEQQQFGGYLEKH